MGNSARTPRLRRGPLRAVLLVGGATSLVVLLSVAGSTLVSTRERLVVIGDSLSTGLGSSATDSWPVLVEHDEETHLDQFEVVNAAQNGSGYVTPGDDDGTFMTEVTQYVTPEAKVVLFFGSDNDVGSTSEQIREAAKSTFEAARAKAPNARIIVVGPPSYTLNPDGELLEVRDALRLAAFQTHSTFVDPIAEGWIADHVDELIGPDGEHPNAAGHLRLAQLMENVLNR
ncbi:SGNH/GDSL hydrolase family protein [Sinomonas sp. ASV322]|uniref:SGNH/GDSL hydrolase family protein n=1 Tax=Sinomonas sp. ASV322 TaxID=3041920 RepID=UPI0027DBCC39|nr:SGNH/GDSL hydrolase family protein [Sinomonas sp. ASV322]MDQ4500721.1 SGNH/GDSL hydrolase family protein [Sinomonas sp. ASV322]